MSGAAKYRKKPVMVEAIQYLPPGNCEVVWAFLGWPWPQPDEMAACYHDPECDGSSEVLIDTLEGQMRCDPGDWIIRGVKGEFYPCKADIFDATYEPVRTYEPEWDAAPSPTTEATDGD